MAATGSMRADSPFELRYASLRNVVSEEDKNEGRNRYCGIAAADALFDLGWDENVRSYLGEDEEGNKRKSTLVNLAIRDTIAQRRELFPMLNTGLVIVARSAKIMDEKRCARLFGASIINGAQTAGVLREYFREHQDDQEYPSVSFELIVTDDEELIGEISIARNFQNKVADLSIYGRKELFDPLEKALQKRDRTINLRKSETDFSDEYLDTEKLIQALTALLPSDIPVPSASGSKPRTPETDYRVYAYRHRARCLKDFAKVMLEPESWPDANRFFLSLAWDGWQLYKRLKGEQSFSHLKKVQGDRVNNRKIVSAEGVPDGIVFPMLSALSRFVARGRHDPRLTIPANFPWDTLFKMAAQLFKNTADHNPNTMGKNADCYIALHGLLEMFFAVSKHD